MKTSDNVVRKKCLIWRACPIKINCIFFAISFCQDSVIKEIPQIFPWNLLVRAKIVPQWCGTKNWTMYFWRELSCKIDGFQYYLWSFAFSQCWKTKTISSSRNVFKKVLFFFDHNRLKLWLFQPTNCRKINYLPLWLIFLTDFWIFKFSIFSGKSKFIS